MKLFFCQNDCPIRGEFWQKNSFITHILFELCLFWYLLQSTYLWDTLYLIIWSKSGRSEMRIYSWAVVEQNSNRNSAQIASHKNRWPANSAHNMRRKSSWHPLISCSTSCAMNFDALKYMKVNLKLRPSTSFRSYDDPMKFRKSILSSTNNITVLKLQLACYPVSR